MYPESLRKVVESFKLLPGIGEKTAERLAFSVLEMDPANVEVFADNVLKLQKSIKKCRVCNVLSDEEVCPICSNESRNGDTLCIVDDSKSVFLFEKLDIFHGKYFVLDGLISPIDGISPDDIGLGKLMEYLNKEHFKEVIIAVKPSIEGETTALYIKKILEDLDITVSKMANGIPMGAEIEYLDTLTLERALKDRTVIE